MKKIIVAFTLVFLSIFLSLLYIIQSREVKDMEVNIEEDLIEYELEDSKEEIAEEKEDTYKSPLSGLDMDEELLDRRIVGVMLDDHPRARWQAGLNDAEVVYEVPVEAPYTRYLAFFLMNEPESLGPIRSSRPYFVSKILEFDSIYVRVGGSEEAKSDIINYKIDDIDGLASPASLFYRNRNKRAPNNLYTSMDKILEEIERKNFKSADHEKFFLFNKEDKDFQGYRADSIFIDYRAGNTSEYFYDEENRVYNRYKDKKLHIDELDQSKIQIKNIIVQYVPIKTIDNEGRKSVELIGEGKGQYFSNGFGKDIIWKKKSRESITKYYDLNGKEIYINKGNTWISIVDESMSVIVK